MKKLCLFVAVFAVPGIVSAEGSDFFSKVGDDANSYLPYVQELALAICCVISIVCALSLYVAMQNGNEQIKKRMMMCIGSVMTVTVMIFALPTFFGYESGGSGSGSSDKHSWNNTPYNHGSEEFVKGGELNTEIPTMDDPRWNPDMRFIDDLGISFEDPSPRKQL